MSDDETNEETVITQAPAPEDPSRFFVTYSIEHHPGGITPEQAREAGAPGRIGATHDLMLMSGMHSPDGGYSVAVAGRRFDGAELSPFDEWRMWTLMTHRLSRILPADDPRKALCADIFGAIANAIAGDRGDEGFVVKVQLPQNSVESDPGMLVYNEDRSVMLQAPVDDGIAAQISERGKGYFRAHLTDDGLLMIDPATLLREDAEPDW